MRDMLVTTKVLSTGYLHISFPGGFAQLPQGFCAETIPDEYIFDPDWNRERVNSWWRQRGIAAKRG